MPQPCDFTARVVPLPGKNQDQNQSKNQQRIGVRKPSRPCFLRSIDISRPSFHVHDCVGAKLCCRPSPLLPLPSPLPSPFNPCGRKNNPANPPPAHRPRQQ